MPAESFKAAKLLVFSQEGGKEQGRGQDTRGITLLNSTANEKCLFSKFNLPRRLVDVVITPTTDPSTQHRLHRLPVMVMLLLLL